MDTGRGPEQTGLEFLRPISLFWVPHVTSDVSTSWIQEEVQRMPEQTGLEFLRLICFIWVVLYIVTRVIDIYIIDERRGPENARADWP